ncbi:MAG: sulfite exporter TauE/SafE family protein [Propioniciclava sp.]
MTLPLLLVAGLILLGSVIQGSIGFGLGMVVSPALVLIYPEQMPGVMIMLGGAISVAVLASEWRSIDWPGFGWALLGRLPGLVLGAWLVVIASQALLSIFVGLAVVIAAVLQGSRWQIPKHRSTLVAAGFVSGTTGTVSGVGGPPVAMVYAGEPGPQVRATLSAYFIVGTATSLLILGVVGKVHQDQLGLALTLLPALLLGTVLARPLARFLDSGYTRRAILVLAGVAGALLVVSNLLVLGY